MDIALPDDAGDKTKALAERIRSLPEGEALTQAVSGLFAIVGEIEAMQIKPGDWGMYGPKELRKPAGVWKR